MMETLLEAYGLDYFSHYEGFVRLSHYYETDDKNVWEVTYYCGDNYSYHERIRVNIEDLLGFMWSKINTNNQG